MIYSLQSDFTKKNKAEIEKQLQLATDWITNDLGLNYNKTRLGKYLNYLQGKEQLSSLDDFKQYIMTAREVDDLLRVFNSFIGLSDSEVSEKIKTVISGQYYRFEAAKEEVDRSRDYLHELSIASRFKNSGLKVDITGVCDVVIQYEKLSVYIECKRIKSELQLMKRFKKAEKQLKVRLGTNRKNKIGFIALDITDLINVDDTVYRKYRTAISF